MSLPSRGAWIEMVLFAARLMRSSVAPLTGSVDRNIGATRWCKGAGTSLPSRGAWIEIRRADGPLPLWAVAPLTGSVDRNRFGLADLGPFGRRSPHGERG